MAEAAPGHDHGEAPPSGAAPAGTPRVASHSDAFELVALVERAEMVIYLDRYATNEPVTGAAIEVEVGNAKGKATPRPDGTYHFAHEQLGRAGTLPVSFTIVAGNQTDLLAGDLNLPPAHADDDHDDHPAWWRGWPGYAAGAALTLALTAWALRRLRRARRSVPL